MSREPETLIHANYRRHAEPKIMDHKESAAFLSPDFYFFIRAGMAVRAAMQRTQPASAATSCAKSPGCPVQTRPLSYQAFQL